MKVLYITHYSHMYGANRSLLDLIDSLSSEITPFVIIPVSGPIEQELKKRNIDYKIIPFKKWVQKEFNSKYKEIKEAVKSYGRRIITNLLALYYFSSITKDIDIIHTNASVTNFGALLAKYSGKKHVWHIREFGKEDYGLKYPFWEVNTAKYMAKNANAIVCISDAIKRKYSNFVSEEKLSTIYNGIFPFQLNKVKSNRVNLVITGILNRNKGQKEAILAINELVKKGYDVNLNIVGDGIIKEELMKFVEDKGLQKNVIFHGYLKEPKQVLKYCDIGLMCSTKEAFGRTTIEYMMAKLAVVGSKSGGTPEILGDTGLLYTPGDYSELASKIEELLKNQSKRRELQEKAFKRVQQYFIIESTGKEVLKVYKRI